MLVVKLAVAIGACDPSPEEIVSAAAAGDLSTVTRGIGEGSGPHLDEALRAAVSNGQEGTTRALLEGGVRAEHLMATARAEHDRDPSREPFAVTPAVASALLDHGAAGNVYLLPHATRTENIELARAVLDHPTVRRALGGEPASAWMATATRDGGAFTAVEVGNPAMLRLLIERGADSNAAMGQAVRSGKPEMLAVVLDAGGDGEVAMEMAVGEEATRRPELVRLLLSRGIRRPRALTVAALHGDAETVRLLLEAGSDDVDTALINARNAGHEEIVQLLESAHAGPAAMP